MIRSKKLRASAKGQMCTFQIPGCCNYDPATSALCHLPDESHGVSRKSDDHIAGIGCSNCHDLIDRRRTEPELSDFDREYFMRRAMARTWRYWIKSGLIQIA